MHEAFRLREGPAIDCHEDAHDAEGGHVVLPKVERSIQRAQRERATWDVPRRDNLDDAEEKEQEGPEDEGVENPSQLFTVDPALEDPFKHDMFDADSQVVPLFLRYPLADALDDRDDPHEGEEGRDAQDSREDDLIGVQ